MTTTITTPASNTAGSIDAQPATGDSQAHQAVALIAQHRLLTSAQIRTLVAPHLPPRKIHKVLVPLREDGLITHTTLPHGMQAHFLTPAGHQTVADWPELRGRTATPIHSPAAARLRAGHILTGARAHLAFLTDARARGDEYQPLDWVPEVTHRLPDTAGADRLIADAVFHYTATSPRRLQYRAFVEIDRATMSSERLARKLITYARFHSYTPQPTGRRGTVADQGAMLAWQRVYPRFPRILFILTGASRPSLAHRIADLRSMAADHELVARVATRVPLGAAVLEDIEEQGPQAPVWTPLTGSAEPRGWTEL
ncbi:replication-relaxation family protein [Streptomyces sp. NBC_00536]|uniref:replication-relaxation family protein n=1 Tax=Streptomyces sp. NBC_00536 TaxID=2975769 RepID=UPI002E803E71|nr:replication-relaxation family protein [Streptomyces sp. NBC_00536]WUC83450.1 replication-relaxation family protein [Streptomyces sp. NBC_00536]